MCHYKFEGDFQNGCITLVRIQRNFMQFRQILGERDFFSNAVEITRISSEVCSKVEMEYVRAGAGVNVPSTLCVRVGS